jgi:hypothetical protein
MGIIQMKQTYYTIEVYNRRKWSDRYSCTYSTKEEAEERARELYRQYEQNDFYKGDQDVPHISNYYRIKENIEETHIHELQ